MAKKVKPKAQDFDLATLESRLSTVKKAVLDTETTGLKSRVDKICGWVWTFGPKPDDTIYLPVRHATGPNLDPAKVNGAIRSALKKNPKLHVVGHNLSFDLGFMQGEDMVPKDATFEDTMVNASLIDERQRSFSLDGCAKFMGVQEKKGEPLYAYLAELFGGTATKNQMGNFWKLAADDPMGLDYTKGDGESTWALWEAQQEALDREELRRVWDVECRCIRTLHRMSTRGIRVDEQRLAYVEKLVRAQYEKLKNFFPPGFGEKTGDDLVKLFTDAGITNWPTTPAKGLPSFKEEWLQTTELGQKVIQVRKLRHLIDAFITPLHQEHIYKGRVHCHYNQTRGEFFGTVTGRLSSDSPNMQQIHKRDKVLGSIFRSIFIPDDGMKWGAPDYNQCEPRLLAHYGEVKVLLAGYLNDPKFDCHQGAADAAGIDRQSGKRLNQGLITGMGMGKTIATLDHPPSKAKAIYEAYFEAMPEIKPFQKKAGRVMVERGYVKSILGRRARLEEMGKEYKALNRLLQCGNADVLKKSMVEVDERMEQLGDTTHLLNNCHDAFDLQFPAGDDRHYREALEIMQDYGPGKSVDLMVPLTVDTDEGNNWAEATYGIETVREGFVKMGGTYRE